MKNHKEVTYTLSEKTLLHIEIKHLMESLDTKKSHSQIITQCLIGIFGLLEEELKNTGGKPLTYTVNKCNDITQKTYTIPVWVSDKLDYYSSKLGVDKSDLVKVGAEVVLNGR